MCLWKGCTSYPSCSLAFKFRGWGILVVRPSRSRQPSLYLVDVLVNSCCSSTLLASIVTVTSTYEGAQVVDKMKANLSIQTICKSRSTNDRTKPLKSGPEAKQAVGMYLDRMKPVDRSRDLRIMKKRLQDEGVGHDMSRRGGKRKRDQRARNRPCAEI